MAITARKIRSLKDIRTNIDSSSQFVEPYKGYLRLGSLEMERSRKLQERDNLRERLRVIEERCRQLDAEKEVILGIIDHRAADLGHKDKVVTTVKKVQKKDYINKIPAKLSDKGHQDSLVHSTKSQLSPEASFVEKDSSETASVAVKSREMKQEKSGQGFKIRY